jgi:hypothetical protein
MLSIETGQIIQYTGLGIKSVFEPVTEKASEEVDRLYQSA